MLGRFAASIVGGIFTACRYDILVSLLVTACGSNSARAELETTGGRFGAGAVASSGGSSSTGGMKSIGGTSAVTAGGTLGTGVVTSTGGIANTKLVAKKISAGAGYACVVLADGSIQCWGGGYSNSGTTTNNAVLVPISGISDAVAVAAELEGGGSLRTCAVLSSGAAQCWGADCWLPKSSSTPDCGQLGNGATALPTSSVPVNVSGISGAVAIASGSGTRSACVLLSNGVVECWGDNGVGQLGNGTAISSTVPAPVTGITSAIGISGSCALLKDGTVQCWGTNLGNGTTTSSSVPVPVTGITNGIAITRSCALLKNGTLQCWGQNNDGELGNGTTTDSLVPVSVTGITDAIATDTGAEHSCAVLRNGAVECWGANAGGELGNGTMTIAEVVPVTVLGITNAIAVAAGDTYSCAVLSDGTVQCWGTGYLGNSSAQTRSLVPVTVSGF